MPQPPDFLRRMRWEGPVSVEYLRSHLASVPKRSGLYVFTNHTWSLMPGQGILYVGKSDRDPGGLQRRLSGYVADPASVKVLSSKDPATPMWSGTLQHAGKAQLLTEIQQKYRNGNTSSHVYVRWHRDATPSAREPALVRYLRPAFNTDFTGGKDDSMPDFHPGLRWEAPVSVERLRSDPACIPQESGLYVFTNHQDPLQPGRGILYAGMTERDSGGLRSRSSGYVKDPEEIDAVSGRDPTLPSWSSEASHAGKMQLLAEIQQKYRGGNRVSGVHVRWHVCETPSDSEVALIAYLEPAFNTHFRDKAE